MKKAFTLLELLLTVAIFSVVAIFLFHIIDLNKKSSTMVINKIDSLIDTYAMQELIAKDIFYADKVEIKNDRDANTQLFITTKNYLSSPFDDKVSYILSSQNNLYRIQSQNQPTREKFSELKPQNIHLIYSDVKTFAVAPIQNSDNSYAFYIEFIDETQEFFSAKRY